MKHKKTKQLIEIPEYIAIERIKNYINECDGDELARLLGEFFGGICFQDAHNPEKYNFELNEYYSGEFNDIVKDTKLIKSIKLKK